MTATDNEDDNRNTMPTTMAKKVTKTENEDGSRHNDNEINDNHKEDEDEESEFQNMKNFSDPLPTRFSISGRNRFRPAGQNSCRNSKT